MHCPRAGVPGSCRGVQLNACCTVALLQRAETSVLISKLNVLKPCLRELTAAYED